VSGQTWQNVVLGGERPADISLVASIEEICRDK
jgi:hypothetical protein